MTQRVLDIISLKEIRVFAYHGVYKQEQELGQKFISMILLTKL